MSTLSKSSPLGLDEWYLVLVVLEASLQAFADETKRMMYYEPVNIINGSRFST